MAGLRMEHVYKYYPGAVAPSVEDLYLEVEDKEFLVLVGPSGCGKSTALRMIAGLEDISKGKLYIGDRLMNDVAPKDRDIAMVFQSYALYPHMSVYQNMAFGLKLRKFSKDAIDARVSEAAKMLDIAHLLDRKPKALSGGQRQRVALGRAIVREPRLFLMDEPLSNLDAQLRVTMRAEIMKLHKRLQSTVIYVTHDQTEAMTMGSRIAVLKDGRLQQVDTPDVLYNHPANRFVAGFIGMPPMNFVEGMLVAEDGELRFRCDGFQVALPGEKARVVRDKPYTGKEVVLGIRPEDLHPAGPFGEEAAPTADGVAQVYIETVENLGHEMYLYVAGLGGGESHVVRVDTHAGFREGMRLPIAVNPEKLHLFEKESGRSILYDI